MSSLHNPADMWQKSAAQSVLLLSISLDIRSSRYMKGFSTSYFRKGSPI